MSVLTENAYLVALLPLMAGVLIFTLAAFQRKAAVPAIALSLGATLAAFAASVALLLQRLLHPDMLIQGILRWLTAGTFDLNLTWAVDNLSAMMLCVVTLISALVQIYSIEYMHHEEGVPRYYGALSLFTFSMLLLVLADNLLVLYAGWELVGVSSYLLIGFFTFKPEAAAAAKKAFLVNRVGDFGFLIGILILFYMTESLEFAVVAKGIAAGQLPGALLAIAALLLFFGPIGKSAQFPLHVWLPDAMEGPTPVSALIHAATMVAAGVYMVAKLMPIFAQAASPLFGSFLVLDFIAWIGGITAILAAAIAVTQNDIKRVLAYSTVSQLGFMMMAMGMYKVGHGTIEPLGYTAGLFHLFTHAFFKAMLFLCSGSVIHAVHTNDMRHMGGLRKYMPITALTCLIGTASISGLPFITAGFWSKDEVLLALWDAHSPLFWVAAIAAIMTTFYMFRLYFLTFEGEYRGEHPEQIHEPGWLMKGPLLLLAVPSIAAGFLGTPWKNYFHDFIHYTPVGGNVHHVAAHHGLNPVILGVSLAVFLIGLTLAWLMYMAKRLDPAVLASRFQPLYRASVNRFYIDEAYLLMIKWGVLLAAKASYFVDKYILDGMLVNGLALLSLGSGEGLRRLQNGRIQTYALAVVSALVLLMIALMWTGIGKAPL
jgi:NADH-quinone oxidoreductase subunit L